MDKSFINTTEIIPFDCLVHINNLHLNVTFLFNNYILNISNNIIIILLFFNLIRM